MAAETPANQPAVATPAARGRVVLDGPPSLRERLLSAALRFCGLFTIGVTVGIVMMLVVESAGFFAEVSPLEFLGDTEWTPLHAHKHFGVWPLVAGTLLTTTIAVMVALPLGLAIAVYMSEIAKPRVRVYVKPVLEVLAGIPTVVYGYFALVFVTPALQTFIPGLAGFNALGPGLVMGFMILPIIASLADDALRAVPVHYREAGLALGATRLATLFRVTLPAAGSGITAGVLLGIARALGETMIVAIAAGQQPRLTADPTVPIETMTAFIVQVSMGDTPAGSLEQRTIFAVGLALFVMTFLMNLVAFRLRQRILGRRS